MISKFNKREIYQQKIITLLTNERYILVSNYFYTHISYLLCFDMDGMLSFDTKYFFPFHTPSKLKQPRLPLSLWDSFPFPPPIQNSNTSYVLPLSGKISHLIEQKQMLVIELRMTIICPNRIYKYIYIYIYIHILICPHIK